MISRGTSLSEAMSTVDAIGWLLLAVGAAALVAALVAYRFAAKALRRRAPVSVGPHTAGTDPGSADGDAGRVSARPLRFLVCAVATLFLGGVGVASLALAAVLFDVGSPRSWAPPAVMRAIVLAELRLDHSPGRVFGSVFRDDETWHRVASNGSYLWQDAEIARIVTEIAIADAAGSTHIDRFVLRAMRAGTISDEIACRFLESRVTSASTHLGNDMFGSRMPVVAHPFFSATVYIDVTGIGRGLVESTERDEVLRGTFGHFVLYEMWIAGPKGRVQVTTIGDLLANSLVSRMFRLNRSLVYPHGEVADADGSLAGYSVELTFGYTRSMLDHPAYVARVVVPASLIVPSLTPQSIPISVQFGTAEDLVLTRGGKGYTVCWAEMLTGVSIFPEREKSLK
jgi:hypothetical protein